MKEQERPGIGTRINRYFRETAVIISIMVIFAVLTTNFVMAAPVLASDLDDFEKASTGEESSPNPDDDQKQKKHNEHGHDDNLFGDFIAQLLFDFCWDLSVEVAHLIGEGAEMSYARVGKETDLDSAKIEIRQHGEATIPYCQVGFKYLKVDSDISANDFGFECGDGPVGFECRNTRFVEKVPKDELSLTQYHLLLRVSPSRSWEYGVGFGVAALSGNDQNSGFSLTVPVKYYPNPHVGIRYKLAHCWIGEGAIRDDDLALVLTRQYASIELGYRWLEANREELNGAYLGFTVHY